MSSNAKQQEILLENECNSLHSVYIKEKSILDHMQYILNKQIEKVNQVKERFDNASRRLSQQKQMARNIQEYDQNINLLKAWKQQVLNSPIFPLQILIEVNKMLVDRNLRKIPAYEILLLDIITYAFDLSRWASPYDCGFWMLGVKDLLYQQFQLLPPNLKRLLILIQSFAKARPWRNLMKQCKRCRIKIFCDIKVSHLKIALKT